MIYLQTFYLEVRPALLRISVFFILTGFSTGLLALDGGEYFNQQAWLDYNAAFVAASTVMIYGDIGVRNVLSHDRTQVLNRVGLEYRPFYKNTSASKFLRGIQLHAGVRNYFTKIEYENDLYEIRLFQGLKFCWPVTTRVPLTHFLRTEQRFIKPVRVEGQAAAYALRLRYALGTEIRSRNERLEDFYFPPAIEFYFNRGGRFYFNDLIRTTLGLGYDFSEKFQTEFNVTYFLGRNSFEDQFNHHALVFRIRFFHDL